MFRFGKTNETIKDSGYQIQEFINKALEEVKEKYNEGVLEAKEQNKEEQLLDFTRAYGGLIGMVDAGVYVSQIKKDPKTAEASVYLMEVFKQFPEVEERFKKFIAEQEELEMSEKN